MPIYLRLKGNPDRTGDRDGSAMSRRASLGRVPGTVRLCPESVLGTGDRDGPATSGEASVGRTAGAVLVDKGVAFAVACGNGDPYMLDMRMLMRLDYAIGGGQRVGLGVVQRPTPGPGQAVIP